LSLLRPRWLEDLLPLHPSASTRVRGLKLFEPHHVVALQDPLYADDPTFWTLDTGLAAVALNLGHIGVQTPADDSLVCIVDGCSVSSTVAEQFVVDVILGATLLLVLATDSSVFKKNRRELSRTTAVERTGLSRIVDNASAFTGTSIASARMPAGQTITIPIGFRLFGSEQLFVRNSTANVVLNATMWGRLTTKGQR